MSWWESHFKLLKAFIVIIIGIYYSKESKNSLSWKQVPLQVGSTGKVFVLLSPFAVLSGT